VPERAGRRLDRAVQRQRSPARLLHPPQKRELRAELGDDEAARQMRPQRLIADESILRDP
jgi:hypothetical protein